MVFSEWTSVLLLADFKTRDLFSGEIPANFNIPLLFSPYVTKTCWLLNQSDEVLRFFCNADMLNYYSFRLCSRWAASEGKRGKDKGEYRRIQKFIEEEWTSVEVFEQKKCSNYRSFLLNMFLTVYRFWFFQILLMNTVGSAIFSCWK